MLFRSKIENMSHQDRNEFLFKLKYSEKEQQAINLYYKKSNKSKSNEDIPEESKGEAVIDASDENIKEASNNLLKLLEDHKLKQLIALN